jgi:putative transposase
VKFEFVAKHRGAWPVNLMCEALGVSRSGFYAWLVRPRSRRSLDDDVLGSQVRNSFVASERTYGARRVWHDVLELGQRCGLHRIERLMRMQALRARPRRRGLPKDQGERSAIADNVLDRQFQADALMMAVWRRGRPQELLHHSDQGSQPGLNWSSQHYFAQSSVAVH